MKSYTDAVISIVEKVRSAPYDYRGYQLYTAISIIYGMPYESVAEDAKAVNARLDHMEKERQKAERVAQNESRRLANIKAGGKKNREPKQKRMDLGV